MFADDCVLFSHTHEELQQLAEKFATAVSHFGLSMNVNKTHVPHQPIAGGASSSRYAYNLGMNLQKLGIASVTQHKALSKSHFDDGHPRVRFGNPANVSVQ